jgi:hypothetical protein
MITFLEFEEDAIVVLRVLGVLAIVDDEQYSSSKQSPKPPESTRFFLKSKNRSNDGERKY